MRRNLRAWVRRQRSARPPPAVWPLLASSTRGRASSQFTGINGKGKCMDHSYSRGMTRRAFGVSFGPGIYVLGMAVANGAPLKKVPTATGIDALYVPFVVAAELKIFEK